LTKLELFDMIFTLFILSHFQGDATMNIFYLHQDPATAAVMHNDKHVVKMILETGQMLSAAHRILDAKQVVVKINKNGNKKIKYEFENEQKERDVYKAAYINHPCTVWCRQTKANYNWLYNLFVELCKEYNHRYGNTPHKSQVRLTEYIKNPPVNIPDGPFEQPPQAMPDQYKDPDSVTAYRNYYIGEKNYGNLPRWTKRNPPEWFIFANTNDK